MLIRLKNIGTLEDASFDLGKDLIILTGPNNSGKTYAAYTVYGCYRLENLHFGVPIKLEIKNSFETITSAGSVSIDLFDCYQKNKVYIQNEYANALIKELYRIFDTQEDFFKDGKIDLVLDDDFVRNSIKAFDYNRPGNGKRFEKDFALQIVKNISDLHVSYVLDSNFEYGFNNIAKGDLKNSVEEYIDHHVTHFILLSIFNKTYFSPAERIAINLFSRPLLLQRSKLVDEAIVRIASGNMDIENIFTSEKLYPLPIRDSLEIAGQLIEIQKKVSGYSYLANIFETKILGGEVSISEYGEVQYTPANTQKSLAIHMSASMVKSLSSLVFYFRHIARKGDFIIIDEPELNLHPDNQRKVARILSRIVNSGFKVMISTHSDYIIRELNNLMMLNKDHPETKILKEKYGYDESEILDYKRVGAYLFKDQTAKPIEVTETGMEAATIDEEINNLNNAATDIYWTLFED